MLSCQSWIAHVDYILESRLHSDILASDVPEEYKVSKQLIETPVKLKICKNPAKPQ